MSGPVRALPVAITATGMITGVGNDSASTCAAIRCAIDNFRETRFMDSGGEWINASEVELEEPWRGETRLLKLAAAAIGECLAAASALEPERTPLVLCLPEKSRPGRVIDDDNAFVARLEDELGVKFAPTSRILTHGRVAAAVAVRDAARLLGSGEARHVIVAGTDSLLGAPALAALETERRLLTSVYSDGLIPGEAGAALVVERRGMAAAGTLLCEGLGFAVEPAPIGSDQPLRADGLTVAIKTALADAGREMHDMDYRIADATGEQYYFKEAALALSRTLRQRKETFDILHPTDCVGETGAAHGLVMLGYQKSIFERPVSARHVLLHIGDDAGKRAAIVLGRTGD